MLLIVLAVILVYEVVCRNLFRSTIWVLSLSFQLYAAIFMLGAAFTLLQNAHIRVTLFWDKLTEHRQLIVDLIFYLVIFFPLVIGIGIESTKWAWEAWVTHEVEAPQVTLWYEPIYPFKTILPVAFYLLGLQGVAELTRILRSLRRGGKQ